MTGKLGISIFKYVFSESTPSCISWQTRDLSALKLDVSFAFLPALPHCQCSGLLGLSLSLPEAGEVDETTGIWESLAMEKRKWIPCYLHLSPQSHLRFGKLPVLSRSLMPASHPTPLGLSESSIREYFFGWQVGAEEGNQSLGALNAKCISLIYSDKFSSVYFLYYQTPYPSVKTFILDE